MEDEIIFKLKGISKLSNSILKKQIIKGNPTYDSIMELIKAYTIILEDILLDRITIYTTGISDWCDGTQLSPTMKSWNEFYAKHIRSLIPSKYKIRFIHHDILEKNNPINPEDEYTDEEKDMITQFIKDNLVTQDKLIDNVESEFYNTPLDIKFINTYRNHSYIILDFAHIFEYNGVNKVTIQQITTHGTKINVAYNIRAVYPGYIGTHNNWETPIDSFDGSTKWEEFPYKHYNMTVKLFELDENTRILTSITDKYNKVNRVLGDQYKTDIRLYIEKDIYGTIIHKLKTKAGKKWIPKIRKPNIYCEVVTKILNIIWNETKVWYILNQVSVETATKLGI